MELADAALDDVAVDLLLLAVKQKQQVAVETQLVKNVVNVAKRQQTVFEAKLRVGDLLAEVLDF